MSESFWPRGKPGEQDKSVNSKVFLITSKKNQILGDFAPPAIAWGGTIGFGWGVIRYLALGYTVWHEAVAAGIIGVVICFGIFYIKAAWKRHIDL